MEGKREEEFRREVLSELYRQWLDGKTPEFNLENYMDQHGLDKRAVWKVAEYMDEESLIKILNPVLVTHTLQGIFHVEEHELVDPTTIKRAGTLRKELILSLSSNFDLQGFLDSHSLTDHQLWNYGDLLEYFGLIRMEGIPPDPELTAVGREEVARLQKIKSRTKKFSEISNLLPQERGRKFQAFVGEMLEQEGWSAETSTRSTGEEIDIIFNSGREYYLVECRWEQDPVEAKEMRDFSGKLDKRIAGIAGCFVSTSGFSRGAVEEAQLKLSTRMILLFGPGDIDRWINGDLVFEELLNTKFDLAIKKRQLIFK